MLRHQPCKPGFAGHEACGRTSGAAEETVKIVVTGGAGFIGSAVCRYLVRETDAHVVNVDKLTYAANLRSLEPIANSPRYTFIRADICDRDAMDAVFAKHRARCGHAPRRRKPRRPLDQRLGRLHPHQRARHPLPAGGGARLLDAPACRARASLPLPARLDRRGLRLARRRRRLQRGRRPTTLLALLGLQGRRRPSGQRLAPHLWTAGRHLQLLQQLRALPFPREADPAGDPQRARGQAAARLRRRLQRARLAVRRGPCARACI